MKNHAWLRFIPRAQTAMDLREIFNKTYSMIGNPHVFKMFSDRIKELLSANPYGPNANSLNDLLEDIEDEIETRAMSNSKKSDYQINREVEAIRIAETRRFLKVASSLDTEIIRDIEFQNSRDLIYKAEKELILKTLEALEDNRTQSAKVLGVSIRTLRNKLNGYAREASQASFKLPLTPNH